ncbi:palmitoyltransferase ZDHHC11-like isoform X7 [Hyaena hyaena]|uniref:palmitoyltransferase ZDHHC11-like isoform X7 n=1 Tax=Hyaena hyaena TaxID=95912 RepID=UPI00192144F2|nr:palmitoyltransferase ZDHHC11-like isoform X7 [Hyaena hyaena]
MTALLFSDKKASTAISSPGTGWCCFMMDLCGWSQRQAVLEARNKRAPVSNLSRVNGWSWPLHPFQALAWTMVFIFALANFGVFIPFLPPNWNFIAYGVTGGLFLFHLVVHLTAVSIDPAEAAVRLRNYAEPLPVFDRTKHAHVIQNQYCHLCQVTVYFFSSLVSSSISLLCLITILLFIFIQFFINPAQLRTHPHYKNISDANTWLLFLPLFPVKTKTLGVLGIGLFVLLLSIFSLVMLGHLLIFHVYLMSKKLSTYEFLTQGHSQKTPKVSAGPEPLFIKVKMPQEEKRTHRDTSKEEGHLKMEAEIEPCTSNLRNDKDFQEPPEPKRRQERSFH